MKTTLESGMTLSRATSFNGVEEVIELVTKFNYGWLVNRHNTLSGNVSQFVYNEKWMLRNFK